MHKMDEASFTSLMKGFIGKKEEEKKEKLEESNKLRSIAFINKVLKEVEDDDDWQNKVSRSREELAGGHNPLDYVESEKELKELGRERAGFPISAAEKRNLFMDYMKSLSPEERAKINAKYFPSEEQKAKMSPAQIAALNAQKVAFQKNITNQMKTKRGYVAADQGYNLALAKLSPRQVEKGNQFIRKALITYLQGIETGNTKELTPELLTFVNDLFPKVNAVKETLKKVDPTSEKFQAIIENAVGEASLEIDTKFWNSRLDAYNYNVADDITAYLRKKNIILGKAEQYGGSFGNPPADAGRAKISQILPFVPVQKILELYNYYRGNREEVARANIASVRGGRGELSGNPDAVSKTSLIGSEEEGDSFVPARHRKRLADKPTSDLPPEEWKQMAASLVDPEQKKEGAQSVFKNIITTMARKHKARPEDVKSILSILMKKARGSGVFTGMKSFEEVADDIPEEEHSLVKDILDKLDPSKIATAKFATDLEPPLKTLARSEAERTEKDLPELKKHLKSRTKEAGAKPPGKVLGKEPSLGYMSHTAQSAERAKREKDSEENRKKNQLTLSKPEIEKSGEEGREARRKTQFASIERARELMSKNSPEATEEFMQKNPEVVSRLRKAAELLKNKQIKSDQYVDMLHRILGKSGIKVKDVPPAVFAKIGGIDLGKNELNQIHKGEFAPKEKFHSLRGSEFGSEKRHGRGYEFEKLATSGDPESFSKKELLNKAVKIARSKMGKAGMKQDSMVSTVQYILGMIEQGKLPEKYNSLKGDLEKRLSELKDKPTKNEGLSLREMILGPDGKEAKREKIKDKPWEQGKPEKKSVIKKMTLKELLS